MVGSLVYGVVADANHASDDLDSALRVWLDRLSVAQRREAEDVLRREPELRAELGVLLADAGKFDRWLASLSADERAPIELAVAGDADLREEVGVLIGGIEPSLRDAFLRRFQRALVTKAPGSPVIEGLLGVASELRRNRRREAEDGA
jgi:hypothetical protein